MRGNITNVMCRGWQQAPGFWRTALPLLALPATNSAEAAVAAVVRSAPLQSVAQFLAVRQASACTSANDSSCTQPAVVTAVSTAICSACSTG